MIKKAPANSEVYFLALPPNTQELSNLNVKILTIYTVKNEPKEKFPE